jgi:glycosyltransferase involved in cell wall biosynthesis
MPCFNHGHFVAESINAILRQTDADLELIIVDDCSSDCSWEIIQSIAVVDRRIRAIRHEYNQGASRSRNDGLLAANGEFIGFCDADDIWEPSKLKIQVKLLQDNPAFDVTYCDSIIINETGLSLGRNFSDTSRPPPAPSGWLFQKLLTRNFINMQTVLMRKICLQHVSGFDEEIKWVEDWWYWLRLSHAYRFLYSFQPLARYRVHAKSTNLVQKRNAAINRIRVFRKVLANYSDLRTSDRADILRNIGAELCDLGKRRAGRRLLAQAIGLSFTDIRAFFIGCRASWRLFHPVNIKMI